MMSSRETQSGMVWVVNGVGREGIPALGVGGNGEDALEIPFKQRTEQRHP